MDNVQLPIVLGDSIHRTSVLCHSCLKIVWLEAATFNKPLMDITKAESPPISCKQAAQKRKRSER